LAVLVRNLRTVRVAYWIILDETCTNNNNNNNIHVSIPPLVVTSEAVVAQVTSLLFSMSEIKKVSLKPGFEYSY